MIGELFIIALFCTFVGFLIGFYVLGTERDEEIKKRIEREKEAARWEGYLNGYDAAIQEYYIRETIEKQKKKKEGE